MTDDAGYGVSGTFGGVIPTPALDRIAQHGSALHAVPFDRAVLADARGADHRPQPSLGRLRRDLRAVDRLSRLRLRHRPGQRHDRHHPEGERLRHLVVRQEPQHAGLSRYSPAGPFDQWPSGMGFEYFYGFMGGETDQWTPYLFRNHTQIFPWVGKPGYNLITDMADDAIEYIKPARTRPRPTSRSSSTTSRRHPRAAPADAGMDRQVQGQVRHGLERHARRRSSPTRSGSASSRQNTQLTALAGRPAEVGHADGRREEAVRAPGRGLRRLRRLHRPRDRPRDPGGRGHGQARQHADHLHRGRQRHQRRRVATSARRTSMTAYQRRHRYAGRGPAEILRRLGLRP